MYNMFYNKLEVIKTFQSLTFQSLTFLGLAF